jgi:uncharacterized protein
VSKKALIVWGGWDGHQPKEVASIFDRILRDEGFETEISDTLDSFKDEAKLSSLNLIVPVWTMGTLPRPDCDAVFKAVRDVGVGVAGCHGGMCDAFRLNTEWQFMTGGQWVAHPGNEHVTYRVKIGPVKSPITEGIKDFDVTSEQYYMHVDPAVKVLATTEFPTADGPHVPNGKFDMPVVWTKYYGKGKVFYNSLGHSAALVESEPCLTILRRGCVWAAR